MFAPWSHFLLSLFLVIFPLWKISKHLCPSLCDPMDYSPPGSSVHGDFPSKNMGRSCHSLLHWIFSSQRSNLGLLHWQADSLPSEPPGKSCVIIQHLSIYIGLAKTFIWSRNPLFHEVLGENTKCQFYLKPNRTFWPIHQKLLCRCNGLNFLTLILISKSPVLLLKVTFSLVEVGSGED